MHPISTRERPTRAVCEEHFPYDFGGRKEIARLRKALDLCADWNSVRGRDEIVLIARNALDPKAG